MFSLLLLLLLFCLFLFIPFRFSTQKGEDRLSHAAEWSPSHPLQHCDRHCVCTEHKADSLCVPLCAHRSGNGWCPAPVSVYEASENSAPYPPEGPETRPPLL